MKNFLKICLFLSIAFAFMPESLFAVSGDIKVLVSEYIPWAGCECVWWKPPDWICKWKDWGAPQYECTIKPWFGTITSMMWAIIKWFTALTALAGVLFIVINGILLSMWSDKAKIKERIVKTLTGLILLLLSGVILSIIAPWVYK